MKNIKLIVIFAMIWFSLPFIADNVYADTQTTSYDFNKKIYIDLGETYLIEVSKYIEGYDELSATSYTYVSSNKDVADVSCTGFVSSYSAGVTNISVTNDNINGLIVIYVVFNHSGYEPIYYPDEWISYGLENRSSYVYALDIVNTDSALEAADADGNYGFVAGEIANLLMYEGVSDREVHFSSPHQVKSYIIDDIIALNDNYNRATAIHEIGVNEVPVHYRHKIMLFVAEVGNTEISLWYRQNDNGTWSCKWGNGEVTNKDLDGNIICNPLTCAKNSGSIVYEFVACYAIDSMD